MIAAGNLSERVTFERRHDITGAAGKVTTTWTAVATVWAQQLDPLALEKTGGDGVLESGRVTFRVRYLAVTPADRLCHGSEIFNIVSVKTLGRREGLEIQCEAA
ncbi:head-tail adaptor protein [Bosea sp. RCC_152_1]|uniref:phage head completion protein n=1 Tax=Bosea sp. RCC_152_1 TaxID=3239228 RepID=UPI0035241D07